MESTKQLGKRKKTKWFSTILLINNIAKHFCTHPQACNDIKHFLKSVRTYRSKYVITMSNRIYIQ